MTKETHLETHSKFGIVRIRSFFSFAGSGLFKVAEVANRECRRLLTVDCDRNCREMNTFCVQDGSLLMQILKLLKNRDILSLSLLAHPFI